MNRNSWNSTKIDINNIYYLVFLQDNFVHLISLCDILIKFFLYAVENMKFDIG